MFRSPFGSILIQQPSDAGGGEARKAASHHGPWSQAGNVRDPVWCEDAEAPNAHSYTGWVQDGRLMSEAMYSKGGGEQGSWEQRGTGVERAELGDQLHHG